MTLEDGRLIHRATVFAAKAHKGQTRKGTDIDYLSHPMEVMTILAQMDAPVYVQAAGALHDVLEDTAVTRAELREAFGSGIAELVGMHTEDKSKSWMERKKAGLNAVRNGPHELRLLVLADRLANARSQAADLEELGDALWNRFNEGWESQQWYMKAAADALSALREDPSAGDCFREYEALVELMTAEKTEPADGEI